MNTFIGIDLGTSSVKLLLVQGDGKVLNSVSEEYSVFYPHSGWSEQNPSDWYSSTVKGIKRLLEGFDKNSVKGISFGGQMHGLVTLDKNGDVIRPAILWNDGRTEKQVEFLNNTIGKKTLSEKTANIAFAGFTAPKIIWMKENEPQNYDKIAKIMLPKDYLAYRLCGEFSTDFSDASGMLLLDVKNRKWSLEMCKICGVNPDWLPKLNESFNVIGTLKAEIAKEFGLSSSVKIIAGAGDNAAAAVGTGTVNEGDCNISLGTSGTIFISSDKFSVDSSNALHSFCHANGKFHLMGCILSAASCSQWWVKDILKSEHNIEETTAEKYIGNNNIFFLPYLMGERSPHNDVNAKGAFIGLRADTDRAAMTLAVLEGVAFALKDCHEVASSNQIKVLSSKICGGGAKSGLWRKIIANVFGMPIEMPLIEEGPSYGAAILAMCGCGEYPNVIQAVKSCVKTKGTVFPDDITSKRYADKYEIYKEFYPALKNIFKKF